MSETEKLCEEENVDGESVLNQKSSENENPINKHHRKRKKQYYNAIRNQMEFYFSDANLLKDRFLKKLITEDPCKCSSLVNNSMEIIFLLFICSRSVEYIYEFQQNKSLSFIARGH